MKNIRQSETDKIKAQFNKIFDDSIKKYKHMATTGSSYEYIRRYRDISDGYLLCAGSQKLDILLFQFLLAKIYSSSFFDFQCKASNHPERTKYFVATATYNF
jgi:hypothetical protein